LISKPAKISDENNIDLKLDIPDLPDDRVFIKWQIPSQKDFEWINYTNLMSNNNYLKIRVDSVSPTSNASTGNNAGLVDDEGNFHLLFIFNIRIEI
jgi:hypothetical protein